MTMKILISFLICALSCISNIKCATTGLPDVASIIPPDTKYQDIVVDNLSYSGRPGSGSVLIEPVPASSSFGTLPDGVVIADSGSPAAGALPDGVIIEPVPEGSNLGGIQIPTGGNVPVLIKDDNLLIKPSPEKTVWTSEPILINDSNLIATTPSKEEYGQNLSGSGKGSTSAIKTTTSTSSVTIQSQEPSAVVTVNNGTKSNGDNEGTTWLVTPTLPPTTKAPVINPNSGTPKPLSCPDFDSRYENGKFIVTLDEGKCEMVVSERAIQNTQNGMWAAGRFTPLHTLLTRKYKPEINFRSTTLAPTGYPCLHKTRQTGNFFVVDTVPGRCQMIIGIPALPDLRNLLTQRQQKVPTWNKPRQMPTWPRRRPSKEREDNESSD